MVDQKEHRILKEIREGLKDFEEKNKEKREYLEKSKEDLEIEEINLKIARNMRDLNFKDEVISQIEANVSTLKDLITMTQGELDQLEIDRLILILRKKAAEEIL